LHIFLASIPREEGVMQIRKIVGVSVVFLGASVLFSETARAGDCSELPDDIKIECTDSTDLSDSQAAFCGIWGESKWNNVLPHCLAVEKIKPNGAARIVYAWGKAPQWGINRSGNTRAKAVIKKDTLNSRLPNGVIVQYRLSGDKLRGKFSRGGNQGSIVLERFKN